MLTAVRENIANMIYPEGREERRSLERLSNTDALTGLGNKRAFELALPTAERDKTISVILFDLNNIGLANKLEGHDIGDFLIRTAALQIKTLSEIMTGSERAFRFGGDEFVALVPAEMAYEFAKQVRFSFDTYKLPNGQIVSITGSVGNTFRAADENLQALKARHKITDANNALFG